MSGGGGALAETMRISAAGNLGIGTATPTSTLSFGAGSTISTATADASDNDVLQIGGGGTASNARGGSVLLYGNENASTGKVIIEGGNVTGGDIEFKVNNDVVMVIDQQTSGNVGIGSGNADAPTSLFTICQSAYGPTEGISLFNTSVGAYGESLNIYFDNGDFNIAPAYSSGGSLSNLLFLPAITADATLTLTKTGLVGIGDDANANMTHGLTINQGANDNEILALKSSDCTHGITAQAETDTYGFFKKLSATLCGLKVVGIADGAGEVGLTLNGFTQGVDTTKSTSATGAVGIYTGVSTGTDVAALGADANLLAIRNLGTTRFIFDAEGSGHADVEWTTFSDSRLKKNVDTIPYGLDTVRGLDAKIFDKYSGYIDDAGEVVLEDSFRRMIGFIAQEVQPLVPELVRDVDDKSFYSLDVGRFTPILWSAVKELDTTVQEYQARIEALEAALTELQGAQ
jgi:hypothetical protein